MAIAEYYSIPPYASLFAGVASALLAWSSFSKGRVAFWISLVAALAFGGLLVASRRPIRSPGLSVPDNFPAIYEGCVVDPALLAADRERFVVELAPGARAQVSLFAKPNESLPSLPYGTRVEFTGKARRPHNYGNPGAFDVEHYMARQHIFWNMSADAQTVHILSGSCGNMLARCIFGLRSELLTRLDRLYAVDPYANGMMQAILIGATAKLDRLWTEDYRSTGTFHALVISGGHVAVLAAVLLFFLRIFCVPQWLALLLTLGMAWLYAGITGWEAPVLRSAAGMTLYGAGRCFYREGRLLNILAAVALLFVIADPEELFDASFQLSFLAVALIGAFVIPVLDKSSGPLSNGLTDLHSTGKDIRMNAKSAQFRIELRLLAQTLHEVAGVPARAARWMIVLFARIALYLWEIFITSFFIQIGLALPLILYFHRVSISGLSANAIVVPVLSAVVPLGFMAIAFNSHLLAVLCAWLLSVSRWAVGWHSHWEPDWRIPPPPFWLAALFVLALAAAALRAQPRYLRALAWVAAAGLLAAIVVHPFRPAIERGQFELSAIDVGQGDSILAAFPDGKLMLIDAGGIPSFGRAHRPGIDIGEDVVSPYLWSRSIKRLDVVAMTHAHEDHMGGMSAVLRNFKPKELWVGATQESREWIGVRETARQLHIPIRQMQRSEPFAFGGARIRILAPRSGLCS